LHLSILLDVLLKKMKGYLLNNWPTLVVDLSALENTRKCLVERGWSFTLQLYF
jgi:hypothetical protein